jgi:general secretion pathway protein D
MTSKQAFRIQFQQHHAVNFLSLLLVLFSLTATHQTWAQQSGVVGQSEREIRILQERSSWAQTQTAKANQALADNDFESAFALAKSALDALPAGGDSTAGLRSMAMETFSKASVALAKQRISEGRYDDAELVVKTATEKPYGSTFQPLLSLQKELRNPQAFNRTMTPGFISKVAQAEQLLSEAQGLYDSGRFDAAFNDYQKVLNLDPQNTSARLGMEQVNKQRSTYAEGAYNERRGQMLADVARAWEMPVPKFDAGASSIVEQAPIDIKGTSDISRKLKNIIIPQISFNEQSVREAIETIQKKSRQLDSSESDQAKKGVNIVLKLDPAKESLGSTKVSLSFNDDISLGDLLNYVAKTADLKVKIDPYAVEIVPQSETTDNLILKEYKVPANFMSSAKASTASPGALPSQALPGAQTVGQTGAKDVLMSKGVQFPKDALAIYLPSSSKLVVRNTQENLDVIDSILDDDTKAPAHQIEIDARFLEVSQNNLQELGFDWLMGAFNLPAGSGVYGGGGTAGNQAPASVGNYPFVNPANGYPAGAMQVAGGNVTAGNLTAGNRTGSAAISANALDALLFPTAGGPAAGVLALAGIFTNPQFQVVLRALNHQTGVDLVSAPKVTVEEGHTATINISQRFPYPKQYSPPQIPQTQGGGVSPATPATPTSFETRDVGVVLKVEDPTVEANNYTISMKLKPQVVNFEGFVNYGTPIQTIAPVYAGLGSNFTVGTVPITLTPNTINQPIFSVREVETEVSLNSGQTVVLGGLLREDVQKVQDKTPIAGDLPLIGSLFRSSANQRIKRNLLIFVTAGLLDPAGQPMIKQDDNNKETLVPDAKAVTSEAVPGDASTALKTSR